MNKLGHGVLEARMCKQAPDALRVLRDKKISVEELIMAMESIRRSLVAVGRREAETKELFALLANKKRLQRLSQALEGRGPKSRGLLGPIAAHFGLSVDQLEKVARKIPDLHLSGKRRPRERLIILALIRLSRFVIDRTGTRPQYNHLVSLVNAAFPELGTIRPNTAQKRMEKIRQEPWIDVPPLYKLGGDRNDRRTLVLSLMQQASQDILTEQLDKMCEPARQRKKSQDAQRVAAQEHEAMRQREENARRAWEAFSNFSRRRNLTSGEQKRIEPIIRKVGGWRVVERQWKSWEEARNTWIVLWCQNQPSWESIIKSLK
jgi:hypothetical protein